MRTLKFLLQKEFRQIFRNPTILRMILAVPIIQLIILPLAADFEIKNVNVAIVDHDRSDYSTKLVQKIQSSGYFIITHNGQQYAEAFQLLESDQADLILEIPAGFERNLIRDQSQDLFLAVNAINGTKANVGGAYLGRVLADYNQEIRLEWVQPQQFSQMPTVVVHTMNWFNTHLRYQVFMVPGILALLVTMVAAYMSALNIVKEKEVGTIEQINVTPIKKHYFLLGKLIPFWVIGNIVFSIGLLGVARLVYGIVPIGSYLLLYAYLALYLIATLGIGLLISTYANTQQQAMSLAFFVMMIFILMSGLFTPIESMPEWAQWIAHANPVTYFIQVLRMVVLKGSTFADVQQHFLIMLGFAVLFNSWAILNYKKTA